MGAQPSASWRRLARRPIKGRVSAAVALAGGGRAGLGNCMCASVFSALAGLGKTCYFDCTMTLEEIRGQDTVPESTARMQGAGKALHELLVSAQRQGCLTAGVYESAKVLNVDPDNVTFCVLAADEEDEGDIALQIHFTLIQAFCCENDIDIVRVGDVQRLAAIVGTGDEAGTPGDLHCILISNPNEDSWKDPALEKLSLFCEESRSVNDWVPNITLPE
uniref:Growth arrest and DNA damage-inducible protein GADD45 gamma n=2 Tax=Sciurus TaxID=10001 RepID=A0A8D2D510_SCIVU